MEEIFAMIREFIELKEDITIPDQSFELVGGKHYTLDIECSRFLCTTSERLINRCKIFSAYKEHEMIKGTTLRLHFIFY